MIALESVLTVVIALIALNLLVVGCYIILVLREVRRTVKKASIVMDQVDRTVKDGIEKASAMEAPISALAATTVALTGVVKGASVLKRATESILSTRQRISSTSKTVKKQRFFKKG